jgi:hypothetical protein
MDTLNAMKLALEALEDWNSPLDPQPDEDIITALRQAIEQAQKQEKTSWTLEDVKKSWKSGYQAGLEQAQKQEPVAFIDNRIHGFPDCFVNYSEPPHTSPVYTSPPQRQPLTDEQIRQVMQSLGWTGEAPSDIEFARAIEAAHGIVSDDTICIKGEA